MTPERHAQIKAIFTEAMSCAPNDRSALLERRCAGDESLRSEVERLLGLASDLKAVRPEEAVTDPVPPHSDRDAGRTPDPAGPSPSQKPPPLETGTILAERFRIVAWLGSGAMGAVYRAEDLVLHQTVALKFLDPALAANPLWLTRFRHEARLAREITHPNVCRTFDIGEADGAQFLTMEYVDGENLASLLKRIGRVPSEKGVEIGRQICLGVAAAHGAGILHRDLKPANIMLDGRGQVRITDFGIAGWAGEIDERQIRVGTPAFMAPEQSAGREVTVQSDLYALGLVLYELFAGRPPFAARTKAEFLEHHRASRPDPLSVHAVDVKLDIEQVIAQCLEKTPADRPSSALLVAAAFMGGDPLAAALSANLTPTPEMVAATTPTSRKAVRPSALLGMTIALLVAFLAVRSGVQRPWVRVSDKPPAALAEIARALITTSGYDAPHRDQAFGFCDVDEAAALASGYRTWDGESQHLATTPKVDLVFWYRSGSKRLVPSDVENVVLRTSRVTPRDPPSSASGMVSLVIDLSGRLLLFAAVPEAALLADHASSDPVTYDGWDAFFDRAGLDPATVDAIELASTSRLRVDHRSTWQARDLAGGVGPVLVEAYAVAGRPVFFAVSDAAGSAVRVAHKRVRESIVTSSLRILFILITAAALPWAWLNHRAGRSDHRGAKRLAVLVLGIRLGVWLLRAEHFSDLNIELLHLSVATLQALGAAALVVVLYTALEPFARRYWPHALIAWSRAVALCFRDSVVGRHVLVGTGIGCFWALITASERALVIWLDWGARPELIDARVTARLLGGRLALAGFLDALPYAIFQGLLFLLLLASLRALLRRPIWAAVLAGLIIAPIIVPRGANLFTALVLLGVGGVGVGVWTMFRYGLVSLTVALFVAFILNTTPITLDPGAWYVDLTLLTVAIVSVLATLSFLAARSPAARL